MSMVTRCPSCETLFRVTPQQLQAHDGQVRCGCCMTVFDGAKRLATLPEATPRGAPPPPAAASVTSSVAEAKTATLPEKALMRGTAAPAAPEPAPALSVPTGFEFEPIEAPRASALQAVKPVVKPAAIETDAHSRVVSSSLSTIRGDQSFLEQARSEPRRSSRAWGVGSALMLLAAAGQTAYFYRSDLVANYPALKPAVEHLCELLQCSVPLPQRSKLINIEASDLQILDPARPGVIQLTATLRNHAGYEVGYPALDLVLTNTKEHTLARRIFLPEDYLEKSGDVKSGLPANAEVTVRLDLDTGELGAAGFRLGLLPAPMR